jgi:predicted cupin superfamily sugar epimerase
VASAEKIIRGLGLQRLEPEGGYYVRTYLSSEKIPRTALPGRYNSDKPFGSAIYYLLTPDTCSVLHRLRTDEIFHFYSGDPVEMLQLGPDGTGRILTLGTDLLSGMHPQVIVPKGVWMGARLHHGGRFALFRSWLNLWSFLAFSKNDKYLNRTKNISRFSKAFSSHLKHPSRSFRPTYMRAI